jgi:succinate dehydrogenase / fumarate reductase cytochrome b subunit
MTTSASAVHSDQKTGTFDGAAVKASSFDGAAVKTKVVPRTSVILAFWDSTIGKKVVMAITGFVLVGFVIGHMAGNLKIFAGEAAYNGYAEGLRTFGAPFLGHGQGLWIARLVLLASVVLHIVAATQLARRSWAARPSRYAMKESLKTNYAARTMRWSGVIIVVFVIYHLLHFTFGVTGLPAGQRFDPANVYRNVVGGFSLWYVSLFYVVAQVLLGMHLFHGVWSMFQTVGVTSATADRTWRTVAILVTLVVVLGNLSVPIAVLAGVLK